MTPADADAIVIGSGIGGLCCAALLARYGFETLVCEAHNLPGGAAHGFERAGFRFDSGPSLYSGLSRRPSPNPLRQVLDAVGEDLPWLTYDTWGCWLPEGRVDVAVGAEPFCAVLADLRGPAAVAEWRALQRKMAPLGEAAIALPPLAVRWDWGAIATAGPFLPNLLGQVGRAAQLAGPFAPLLDGVVSDPFLRRWLDLLCFLLSGLPAAGTSAAEMAFMFADWYRPGVVLDYPQGGSDALVRALVRGLERHGGTLRLNAPVAEILLDGDRAVGVRLADGTVLRSRRAVVSNASVWDTLALLPPGGAGDRLRAEREALPRCPSFMHLHLGIDGTGLPPDLPCHHIVVEDWERGVDDPQNVALVSMPSVLDPSLAPPGGHVLHAYLPATEPYERWAGLDRHSDAYRQQKAERSQILWRAVERAIPDVRDRARVALTGSPLTHERFLRRHRGTYGPAIAAGRGWFPGPLTPARDLLCCGDSTFPGIGLPAVAASGAIAANTLAPVDRHRALLRDLGLR